MGRAARVTLDEPAMIDLTDEMGALYDKLGAPPAGRCKIVQFASAVSGEGTSTVAREFARVAALRAKRPVWIVDLDLWSGAQVAAVARESARFGPLTPETTGSPGGSAPFSIEPPERAADGAPIAPGVHLRAYGAMNRRLWVSRFRADDLSRDRSVHIVRDAGYWSALRRHAEFVVVDSPAADRSEASLVVAPLMDTTVLVVAADGAGARAPGALRDGVVASGGRCAGIVFNRARLQPPKFLKALLS